MKYTTMMDGNSWICFGEGFVDLQESENYAFGNTEEEAIASFLFYMKWITQDAS